MKNLKKIAAIAAIGTLALTACTADYDDRKRLQESTTVTSSLGLTNLKEKLAREEDPDSIRYLYVMSFGKVIGYYVTKGKISSSASQVAPEQEVFYYSSSHAVADSAKDDGTYGEGDPGIFFFTTDGVMVVTSLDYIQSDEPLPIDVPRFGGTVKK